MRGEGWHCCPCLEDVADGLFRRQTVYEDNDAGICDALAGDHT